MQMRGLWLLPVVAAAAGLVISGCKEQASDPVSLVSRNVIESKEPAVPATGPLKVHPTNPRYFTDGSGKAIYLTGSHHWNNLVDSGEIGQPLKVFDYSQYLDLLTRHHHNFMRMWSIEGGQSQAYVDLFPYLRTGPGVALDGKPKFDLDRFDETYFERLHSRVIAARDRGIYVSIMLFNGWGVYDHGHWNPWPLHPFNVANNVNDVNGDPDGDGQGKELHSLQVPAITQRQQAYVRKVIDTVNHLDNVLYEISNESEGFSKDWQYHMIRFIHTYEATKPKQHPVGMTSFDASPAECGRDRLLETLLASPADWISPCSDKKLNYATNPFPGNGQKVVVLDTDHIFGVGGDHNWVWKTFVRGLNPIYMDPLSLGKDPPGAAAARMAMGDTRAYANRINLAAMVPRNDVSSTTYCLASLGEEYIVYLPVESNWLEPWIERLPYLVKTGAKAVHLLHRTVTVDLSGTSKEFAIEWFNPSTGEIIAGETTIGGGRRNFTAPFAGDAVLYLSAS